VYKLINPVVHKMIQKTIIVFQETKHRYIASNGEDLNPIFERLCSFSPTIKPPKLSSPIQPHSIAIKKDEKNPSPIEHVLLHSLLLHIHMLGTFKHLVLGLAL